MSGAYPEKQLVECIDTCICGYSVLQGGSNQQCLTELGRLANKLLYSPKGCHQGGDSLQGLKMPVVTSTHSEVSQTSYSPNNQPCDGDFS